MSEGNAVSPGRVRELVAAYEQRLAQSDRRYEDADIQAMIDYLSLTGVDEAVRRASPPAVTSILAKEGLPPYCYTALRGPDGKIALQCNCCGKEATEEHLTSKEHRDMLQAVVGSPKAVLIDLIRQNGKSYVASFINGFQHQYQWGFELQALCTIFKHVYHFTIYLFSKLQIFPL